MNEQIKKAYVTTFVHLILDGRRTVADVPAALQELVKADLGLTEPAATQVAEQLTEQEAKTAYPIGCAISLPTVSGRGLYFYRLGRES
ncbi:hypothetical protein [Paenibacillus sp. FSL R10-2748]|uniref:hypothetical protein n=1 Tax=Paenibacillus sp. FSL R10-2748 TaxID=2954658 RepID=UPI0030FC2482